MKKSYKVALGGLIMALCLVTMAITTVFPFASFAIPAIAGVMLIILNLEFGKGWALLVYLGVAFLNFFISSDHTAIISFAVLLGYYPILKGVIESIRKPVLEWVLKMVCFNVAILIGVFLTILIFGKEILLAEYSEFGKLGIGLFILACNGVFVVYDFALTKVITLIIIRFLPLLKRFH